METKARTPEQITEWAEATELADAKAREDRKDAARIRRNANARARSQAMRGLGLVKTPYGWE